MSITHIIGDIKREAATETRRGSDGAPGLFDISVRLRSGITLSGDLHRLADTYIALDAMMTPMNTKIHRHYIVSAAIEGIIPLWR